MDRRGAKKAVSRPRTKGKTLPINSPRVYHRPLWRALDSSQLQKSREAGSPAKFLMTRNSLPSCRQTPAATPTNSRHADFTPSERNGASAGTRFSENRGNCPRRVNTRYYAVDTFRKLRELERLKVPRAALSHRCSGHHHPGRKSGGVSGSSCCWDLTGRRLSLLVRFGR